MRPVAPVHTIKLLMQQPMLCVRVVRVARKWCAGDGWAGEERQ